MKCKQCGIIFRKTGRNHLYCCRSCQQKFNRHSKIVDKVCVICGATFSTKEGYIDKNTCSKRCSNKRYYINNKQRINKNSREYYQKNKLTQNKYKKERYHSNLTARVSNVLRRRLGHALKDNQKSGSAVKNLGCTVKQLKEYLESKWLPGMSWDNYGRYNPKRKTWHIDHIRPLSKFDLTNEEQFKKACHYTNLQPMWAEDNIKKSNMLTN